MVSVELTSLSLAARECTFSHKHRRRAVFRSASLLLLIFGYVAYNSFISEQRSSELWNDGGQLKLSGALRIKVRRRLSNDAQHNGSNTEVEGRGEDHEDQSDENDEQDVSNNEEQAEVNGASYKAADASYMENISYGDKTSCEKIEKASSVWFMLLYVAGVLYTFLALAIVCDEFFVPSLEEMASERHLNMSMDVAGATLMAAGGSAPELFTALFGTFMESDIGFGAVVGSAVFNVLFVIGLCSLLSKEALQLTWWPLFRDSTYYIFGLSTLAFFVGVNSRGEITFCEALVLLCEYFGYFVVMGNNHQLYRLITGLNLPCEDKNLCADNYVLHGSEGGSGSNIAAHDMRWRSTFRSGVIKLITQPEKWSTAAGVGFVVDINGGVKATFRHVDKNNDGKVDLLEFEEALNDLGLEMTSEDATQTFAEITSRYSSEITEREFTDWYMNCEQHILSKVKYVFDQVDTNSSGTIDSGEIKSLLQKLDPNATDADVHAAMAEMHKRGTDAVTYQEFSEWYSNSLVYSRQKAEVDADMSGVFASLVPPVGGGLFKWLEYILVFPLISSLAITIPDVRRPGKSRHCFLAFGLAIVWIGIFSYFMVTWTELIGNTLGIPPMVMGLTFLAAGTSVPDLLTSVIVARRGEGDMAVSSSIGSNIFDILIGLPLPWLLYNVIKGKSFEIGSDQVGMSVSILVITIVLAVVTIHFCGWKLTKTCGIVMFLFYVIFLAQAIVHELPFTLC